MSKIRIPRDLEHYISAEDAITQLEDMVRMLTDRARPGDLMLWDLQLRFFNPGWIDGTAPAPEFIVLRTRFKSGKTPKQPVTIAAAVQTP